MMKIIGVKFREKGKIYHFDPAELELRLGDDVVVETERGIGYARVYTIPIIHQIPAGKHLKKVLKKATEEDLALMQRNKEKETEAFKFCLEKVKERELPMKLVDTECLQDGSKMIFYFTADGRIDFRELVKDLASRYKTRIEMRQIGVRDEARMISGYGHCGRSLCCSTFLKGFEPVSIKMAKNQSMALNPAKISGVCGRLMCCIGFEAEDKGTGRPPCAGKDKITSEAETAAVLEGEGLGEPTQELEDAEAAAPQPAGAEIKGAPPEKLSAEPEAALTKPAALPPQQQKQELGEEKKRRRRRRRKHRH